MRPVVVVVGPLTAGVANNIATSQTPGAAGNLTLNGSLVTGGVAILPVPRRILITTTDTTHSFTITGTSPTGTLLTETVTNAGTSIQSNLDYATVTSIRISGGASAAVTVGTNGVASSGYVRTDDYAPAPVTVQCTATGTVNYTVQQSMDDPNSPTNPVAASAMTWLSSADTNAVGATGSIMTNFTFAPAFIRILLNSGTGTVTATVTQPGAVPY